MIKNKIDEKIIDILKENSRESFVDIGKTLHLSESAVRRRVKNLTDSKTISKFTLELGDTNTTKAIVLVSVDSAMDTSMISEKLVNLDGIQTVYEITGKYDIVVIMGAENIALVNNSIDALRKVPGVIDTNTIIILRTVA